MGSAGSFLHDHVMHLVHVSLNLKSYLVISLHPSLHQHMQPKPKYFIPRLSLCLRDPHDLVFHGHAWFCLCRIMTECRNVLSKSMVECQTAGNMLVSEDSTCLLKAHPTRWYMCSHVLTLLCLTSSYLLNRLFIFSLGAQSVCCCLFPGHRKRPESQRASERGFFLVHCKNSSIVLWRSPHCCGNVRPYDCLSTDGLCTFRNRPAEQHVTHDDTKTHRYLLYAIYSSQVPDTCPCATLEDTSKVCLRIKT